MANSKNALLRLRVIDRCLRKAGGSSTSEMLEEVNIEMCRRNEPPVSATNTIRADLDFIANNWHVAIDETRQGRRRTYSYRVPDFSILSAPLSAAELEQLRETMLLLSRFSGLPDFGWLEEAEARIDCTFLEPGLKEPVVGFESRTSSEGMRFFGTLFKAVTTRQTVKITYATLRTEDTIEAVIFPYFLKQYNGRWFLLAGSPGWRSLGNYAVDRILAVTHDATPFVGTDVDFDSYFRDIVGITFPDGAAAEDVKIWVSAKQYRYVECKPIHPSQQLVEADEDGVTVSLRVVPNYELVHALLAFGADVRVLAPQSLCLLMKEKIAAMMKNYGQVQIE